MKLNAEQIAEKVLEVEGLIGPAHAFTPYFGVFAHFDSVKKAFGEFGKEVKFLRKVLGLSLEKFANKMSLSSGTVFHWEKVETERLAPVNEVCVRSLLAEELNIDLQAKFSQLLGQSHDRIEVKAS